MLKQADALKRETFIARFGGKGQVQVTHFLGVDEFKDKGRLFSKSILQPGSSIGLHEHKGDFETYVILSGEGLVNDNGEGKSVQAGDVIITNSGEKHSLENTGTINLEFLALILFD